MIPNLYAATPSTVLLPRSIVNNPMYDISSLIKQTYEEDWKTYMAMVGIYQHSHHNTALADYFSINGTNSFTLDEGGTGDMNPVQIGLMPLGTTPAFYSSTITLQPFRRTVGVMADIYHQFDDNVWMEFKIAALQVTTTMDLVETNVTSSGGGVSTILTARDAFNNPTWAGAKISSDRVSQSGIEDIFFKVGYDPITFTKNPHRVGLYIFTMIPNSVKERLEYLLHPIVSGKYTVVGGGVSGDFGGQISSNWMAMLSLDARLGVGLNSWQPRTFDITNNGAWSRYMLMSYQSNVLDVQYGVNVNTVNVLLAQRAQAQATIVLALEGNDWGLQVGYNVWYRQKEQVLQFAPLENTFAIADLPHISGIVIGVATSASTSNVSQTVVPGTSNSMVSDAAFTPFTTTNFNTLSGTNPSASTSTAWTGIRFTRLIDEAQVNLSFNGSYEYAHKLGSIPSWSLWGNLVVEF